MYEMMSVIKSKGGGKREKVTKFVSLRFPSLSSFCKHTQCSFLWMAPSASNTISQVLYNSKRYVARMYHDERNKKKLEIFDVHLRLVREEKGGLVNRLDISSVDRMVG